jgi:hypothetical protein
MYNPEKAAEKGSEKRSRYLKRKPTSPFYERPVDYTCPDGFIMPLIYGLSSLLEDAPNGIRWKTDPSRFLKKNLAEIMKAYRFFMETAGFDPQKTGKNLSLYQFMAVEFGRY